MTHDELLKKIKTGNEFIGVKYAPDTHTFALRAVVELHKPYGIDRYPDLKSYCVHCEHLQSQIWPCPTIEAIEKELQ